MSTDTKFTTRVTRWAQNLLKKKVWPDWYVCRFWLDQRRACEEEQSTDDDKGSEEHSKHRQNYRLGQVKNDCGAASKRVHRSLTHYRGWIAQSWTRNQTTRGGEHRHCTTVGKRACPWPRRRRRWSRGYRNFVPTRTRVRARPWCYPDRHWWTFRRLFHQTSPD